jgi:hypothetical protein
MPRAEPKKLPERDVETGPRPTVIDCRDSQSGAKEVSMSMRADLHGKVVLITGGGVSKATGERLPESGAEVFLADISGTLLDQTIQELKAIGPPVHGAPTDVSKVADCERMVNTVEGDA